MSTTTNSIAVITGTTGFVGSALASRLIYNGIRVIALCRDGEPPTGCEIVRGELEDLRTCERLISEYRPDSVFHLAAQAMVGVAKRDPFNTFEANVRGTYNLLEAFRRHKTENAVMIVASSDKAYGNIPYQDNPFPAARQYHEDDPLEGRGPYDCSKSCADLITQSYEIEYNLNIAIARCGNIYGPGDKERTRIVPSIVDDIINARAPLIQSDGKPVRDYLYIDDAVDAYLSIEKYLKTRPAFINPLRGTAFNFSGNNPKRVLEVVFKLTHIAKDLGIYHKPYEILGGRSKEIYWQDLNTRNANEILKWFPLVSLDRGLRLTLEAAAKAVCMF